MTGPNDDPSSQAHSIAARRFFIVLLVASTVVLAVVVRPLGGALFVAAALATVLAPVHRWLSAKLKQRPRLAAGLLVAGLVVLVLGPLVALSAFVVDESVEGAKFVTETVRSEGVKGLIERLPESVRGVVTSVLSRLPQEPGELLQAAASEQGSAQGTKAAGMLGAIVAATGSLVFQSTMMVIALFFLFVDGVKLIRWIDDASPLRKGQTHELLAEFRKVSYAIIVSSLITAAIQAVAALIGYFMTSVPHPVFFALITFVIAFIPAVGAASVCLVAALLLLVTGHPYGALFLALWGFVVVGLVDNVAKPLLMKDDVEMNGAVVFFSLLGGLSAFGAIGLLIGPLAVAFFMALVRMYQRDFANG